MGSVAQPRCRGGSMYCYHVSSGAKALELIMEMAKAYANHAEIAERAIVVLDTDVAYWQEIINTWPPLPLISKVPGCMPVCKIAGEMYVDVCAPYEDDLKHRRSLTASILRRVRQPI
ncbi:unnamed protein product [Toxocara canis]|uniref:UbiD family decarboxylase n=1 Tax=Toxocara canis TaxID=6265 RepID=A0A183U625_TOXCA|nr:unnamed protein product [Toxocara canis]